MRHLSTGLTLSPFGPADPCAPCTANNKQTKKSSVQLWVVEIMLQMHVVRFIIMLESSGSISIGGYCLRLACHYSEHASLTSGTTNNQNLQHQGILQLTLSDRRSGDFNDTATERRLIKARLNNYLGFGVK